jgi:hypothetical protein
MADGEPPWRFGRRKGPNHEGPGEDDSPGPSLVPSPASYGCGPFAERLHGDVTRHRGCQVGALDESGPLSGCLAEGIGRHGVWNSVA